MNFFSKTTILIFLFPLMGSAQNIESGITCGLITYKGDLIENLVEIRATHFTYGIILRAHLNDKISLRTNFLYGMISGNDSFSSIPGKRARQLRFRSKIYELSLQGEWNLLGKDRSDIHGKAVKQKFTPYFFGGLGLVIFDPLVYQGDIIDPEGSNYETFNMAFPAGFGLKTGLNEQFVLGIEVGGRTALSDYLDGVSQLGNPTGKDWYWLGNLTLTYTFGSLNYF